MSPPERPAAARWTPLAIVYLALAILGLIGTWTLNILALRERKLAA